MLRLVVLVGPDRGATFTVAGAGAIGRDPEAAVRLSDAAVSRRHAALVIDGDALALVHGGGANPTRVNGVAIERAPLAAGDEIELGRTVLRVLGADDDGGVVASREAATALVLDTRELVERAGGGPVPVLARLGDALHRAGDPAALAARVRAVLGPATAATSVALAARDASGRLALVGDGDVALVPAAAAAAAIAHGHASVVDDDERRLLVAPLAPADGELGVAGVVVIERTSPWARADVELVATAARLIGAALGALAARDRATRAHAALAQRAVAGVVRGRSPAMQALARVIAKVAATTTTVLVEGESGTGKEWVAEAIHAASARAGGPLVAVNCGALSESLLEAELFGHEKGAFTGAVERRPGRFEQADGGTLFLDEVGELSEAAQARLLRVLESRRFERLGGARSIAVDVRVVAATHRDLAARIAEGRFRADLFYRLAVVRALVPPLRERPEDVEPLAAHFLARYAAQVGRRVTGFTPAALAALEQHWWPGNVRELRNVIERAVVLGDGALIDVDDLGLGVAGPVAAAAATAATSAEPAAAQPAVISLEAQERAAVIRALEATRGNKAAAAQLLQIDRTTLYKKLRRLGLR